MPSSAVGMARIHLIGSVLETGDAPERDGLLKSAGHIALDVAAASVVHRLASE